MLMGETVMRVYHGSDVEVWEVDLSRSLMFKDFGPGFYVSAQRKQAENFTNYKADCHWSKTKTPVVSVFEMDDACLTDGMLRIKRFEGYSEEWIECIDEYRGLRSAAPARCTWSPPACGTPLRCW